MWYTKLTRFIPDIVYIVLVILFAVMYFTVFSRPEKTDWYLIHLHAITDTIQTAARVL